MTVHIEALKQALEALEDAKRGTIWEPLAPTINRLRNAIEALAAPVQEFECPRCDHCCVQRQWVGLTDIEKLSVCRVGPVYAPDGVVTRTPLEYRKELQGVALMAVRQAEAKLKEKNT